jgi:hypothetical protein
MLTTLLHGLEEEEGIQLTAAVAMIYKSKKESSALNFLPRKHKMGLDHHPANKRETHRTDLHTYQKDQMRQTF